MSAWKFVLAGALTGVANGFFGGGGGCILVPLLTKLCGLEGRKAFATSVAVILPLALATAVWTAMVYVLAAYLLVSALLELYASIRLRSSGVDTKPYYGEIIGSIVLAVILFIIPAQVGIVLVRICGALLVLSGLGVIFWQWRNRGMEYYLHKKVQD